VCTVASAATALAVAPPAAAFPTGRVELSGHGFGHGRGMGQYGALGYALNFGWGYQQILGHYYGNTTVGHIGNPEVTVILRAFDRLDTIVTQERGRMVTNAADGTFTALRAVMTGPNTFRVDSASSCGGPWTTIRSGMQGPVVIAPQNRNDDRQDMLQACEPNGNRRWYRGEMRAVEGLDGTSRTVNAVDMENYLKGTVPRESPASWADLGAGAGMQALKAQAVAARSYAQASDLAHYAKTCDTIACQVYGGRAVQSGSSFFDLEDSRSDRAVNETAGEVRIHNGVPARTEYSSSTGGYTAGGAFPAVPDEGDSVVYNPNHSWQRSIPVSTVQQAYPQVGTLQAVNVTRRNGLGDFGGRALEVQVVGSNGTVTTSGQGFQFALGLLSDWFRVAATGGYWVAAADGTIFAFGDAPHLGSMAGQPLAEPMVGVAATPSGNGYWTVATDGGIFTFGDAPFYGSMGGQPLARPVNGMAGTATGRGYWLVASDGGIFTFGDAVFRGSMGGQPLVAPVVGMAATPSGQGYWLVAADGGIFTFGDAPFYGSIGGAPLAQPVTGMAVTPTGRGYWLVAQDGGIFTFGDAEFFGSVPGLSNPTRATKIGMAVPPRP
jgi:SpoIID/LytB domain protein